MQLFLLRYCDGEIGCFLGLVRNKYRFTSFSLSKVLIVRLHVIFKEKNISKVMNKGSFFAVTFILGWYTELWRCCMISFFLRRWIYSDTILLSLHLSHSHIQADFISLHDGSPVRRLFDFPILSHISSFTAKRATSYIYMNVSFARCIFAAAFTFWLIVRHSLSSFILSS